MYSLSEFGTPRMANQLWSAARPEWPVKDRDNNSPKTVSFS